MSEAPATNLDTPMMRQYLEIKKQYPEDILFFRMGDFYEMFLEDAVYASRVLDIALTRRQDKVPMCGVPHHSMSQYVHPILEQGKRIAICDQLENPAEAQGRIVRRGVTRILTPGTIFEEQLLEAKESRRLAAFVREGDVCQLAIVELATAQIVFERKSGEALGEAATAHNICEWVVGDADAGWLPAETARNVRVQPRRYPITDIAFQERVLKDALQTKNLGVWELDAGEAKALTLALAYVREISPLLKLNWSPPVREYRKKTMVLDEATLRTLEILASSDGKPKPSLLGLLGRTKSAAGNRLMADYLSRPSADIDEIRRRHDAVEILAKRSAYRELIGAEIHKAADLARVLTNLANNPQVRHLGQVRDTLDAILNLQRLIVDNKLQPFLDGIWSDSHRFPQALHKLLQEAILPEGLPPLLDARRFLNVGYMPLLDEFIELTENAVGHLARYESEERARLGIATLRVKHNNVLGYFIEISKGQAAKAPDGYQRRQTLTNGERYTTVELKELENKILSAEDEVLRLQKGVFEDLREQILAASDALHVWAEQLARLDVLNAFADCVAIYRLVRPAMHAGGRLMAKDARHPVIEAYFSREMFIANDVNLDSDTDAGPHLAIITGPNMAGKSTYIRQIGIMQIMAQAGAFVAATTAELPVVDRVFTRIGAHDRLSRGESTFFVEMAECARIFRNYTKDSLILLDEVGRGTSTYDGISIAQAMIESLNQGRATTPSASGSGASLAETKLHRRPKTLFATHYSELAHLISAENGIIGLTVSVVEKDGHIVFLRRIVEGVAEKSFGIHVAQMAGMPSGVTRRAQEILHELEKKADFLLADGSYHKGGTAPKRKSTADEKQAGLFG